MDSNSDDELSYLKPRLNLFKNPNAPIIDVQTSDMGSCKTDNQNGSSNTRAQQTCMVNVNDISNSPSRRRRRRRKKILPDCRLVDNSKERKNGSDWGSDSVDRAFSEISSSSSKWSCESHGKNKSQENSGSTSLSVDSFESKSSKNIQADNSKQSGDHLSKTEGLGNQVVSAKTNCNNIARTETTQIQADRSEKSGDLFSRTDPQVDQVVSPISNGNSVSTEAQQIQADSSKQSGDSFIWTHHQDDQVVSLISSWNGVSAEGQQIQADSSKQSGDRFVWTDHQDQVASPISSWNSVRTETQQIQEGNPKQRHDYLSRNDSHENHAVSLKNSSNVNRLETLQVHAECQTTIAGDIFALNFYQENELVGTLPTSHMGRLVTLGDIEMYLPSILGSFTCPQRFKETVDCGVQTDVAQEAAVSPVTPNVRSDYWNGRLSRDEVKRLDQSVCTKCLAVETHADQSAQTRTTVLENVDKSTDMEGFHPKLYSGGKTETIKKVVERSLQTGHCEVVAETLEDSSSGVTIASGHNPNVTRVCFCTKAQCPKCAVVLQLSHAGRNVFSMHEGSPIAACGEERVAADSSSVMVDFQKASELSGFQRVFDFERSEVRGSREAKTANGAEQSVQAERLEVGVRDSKDTHLGDHYLNVTPACVSGSPYCEDVNHTGQSVICIDEGSANTGCGGERLAANSSSTVVSDIQMVNGSSGPQCILDLESSEATVGSRSANLDRMIVLVALPLILKYILNALCGILHAFHRDG